MSEIDTVFNEQLFEKVCASYSHNAGGYGIYKVKKDLLHPELTKYCSTDAWLAGGSLTDLFIGRKPKDYDFFFKSQDAFERTYEAMQNDGIICLKNQNDRLYMMSNDAQLIRFRFYASEFKLLDEFDLNIVQLLYNGNVLYASDMAGLKEKRMKITNTQTPVSTMARFIRYYREKGFSNVDLYTIHRLAEVAFTKDTQVKSIVEFYEPIEPGETLQTTAVKKITKVLKGAPYEMKRIVIDALMSKVELRPIDIISLRSA